MCTGRVDPLFVMTAFNNGADGVLVAGCRIGECKYGEGNLEALLMGETVKNIIRLIGMEEKRLSLDWVSSSESTKIVEIIRDFSKTLQEIGPLGKKEGWSEEDKKFYLESAVALCNNMQFRSSYGNLAREIRKMGDFSLEVITKKVEEKLLASIKTRLYEIEIKELVKEGPKSLDYIIAKTKGDPVEIEKILSKIIKT